MTTPPTMLRSWVALLADCRDGALTRWVHAHATDTEPPMDVMQQIADACASWDVWIGGYTWPSPAEVRA